MPFTSGQLDEDVEVVVFKQVGSGRQPNVCPIVVAEIVALEFFDRAFLSWCAESFSCSLSGGCVYGGLGKV